MTIIKRGGSLLSLFALLAVLGACTMAPDYQRPASPSPAEWPSYAAIQDPASKDPAAPVVLPQRQAFFADPVMRELISVALINNRDLRVAILNIQRARAQYQIQRADLLPTVAITGANENQRVPADLSPIMRDYISRESNLTVGFTAFELDIFGRVRSLKDAALQNYLGTEFNASAVEISLMAEVASAYLQLAAEYDQLSLAEETYKSNNDTYKLVSQMFDKGIASQLDVSQARTGVESARANMASFQAKVRQAENALVLLLGAPVPPHVKLARTLSDVTPLNDIPAGLPSALLERRPDILAAEQTLKAANANIGAARANFFPRITLTGGLGTASADFSNLFNGGQGVWNFGPAVSLPIFDTGRNIANLDVAETDRAIAVANYEKSIQSAFREVADTLAQRSTIVEQLKAEKALMDATNETYTLSLSRYDIGLDNFLTVLEAQRSLFAARQNFIYTRLLRETNLLTMYKALGGGWQQAE